MNFGFLALTFLDKVYEVRSIHYFFTIDTSPLHFVGKSTITESAYIRFLCNLFTKNVLIKEY
jgi:hypothetical protein